MAAAISAAYRDAKNDKIEANLFFGGRPVKLLA